MTLLIATDEAGYGPRLGPLVVVATAWRLQLGATLRSAHEGLQQPIDIAPLGELRIDDSKRVFVRRKPRHAAPAVASVLDVLTDAAAAWAGLPLPSADYRQWLQRIAAEDFEPLGCQPWFASLIKASPGDAPRIDAAPTGAAADDLAEVRSGLISHWECGGLRLVGIAARVLDAARFNQLVERLANKANLLSHTTCQLALAVWHQHARPAATGTEAAGTHIFSDRHGGRAYYGALLQHHCPELTMQVLQESSHCSSYRLSSSQYDPADAAAAVCDSVPAGSIQWSFTVNGENYPPVALSSIIAKAIREQLMQRFNAYFQAELAEPTTSAAATLRPTAGYGSDARRFLQEIAPVRARRSLGDAMLIRSK